MASLPCYNCGAIAKRLRQASISPVVCERLENGWFCYPLLIFWSLKDSF